MFKMDGEFYTRYRQCFGPAHPPVNGNENAIYLVDTVIGGPMLMYPCKPALESACITKVIHDRNRKRHSEALFFQFGIKLNNVMSTQIAYALIEQQERRMKLPDGHISYVGLLADPC